MHKVKKKLQKVEGKFQLSPSFIRIGIHALNGVIFYKSPI